MASRPNPYLSPDEYLALEREAETKSEYLRGEVYAMAGGSAAHSIIAANAIATPSVALGERPCTVYNSDMRLLVEETGLYTYPNVAVVCGTPRYTEGRADTLLNPTLVVEVLSPSTEAYDRGEKFAHYRRLESLQEYLLVAQDKPRVEQYTRHPDGSWRLVEVQGLTATLSLPTLACAVALARLYHRVELGGEDGGPSGPGG